MAKKKAKKKTTTKKKTAKTAKKATKKVAKKVTKKVAKKTTIVKGKVKFTSATNEMIDHLCKISLAIARTEAKVEDIRKTLSRGNTTAAIETFNNHTNDGNLGSETTPDPIDLFDSSPTREEKIDISKETLVQTLQEVMTVKGQDEVAELLKSYKCKRVSDIKESDYGEMYTDCKDLLAPATANEAKATDAGDMFF